MHILCGGWHVIFQFYWHGGVPGVQVPHIHIISNLILWCLWCKKSAKCRCWCGWLGCVIQLGCLIWGWMGTETRDIDIPRLIYLYTSSSGWWLFLKMHIQNICVKCERLVMRSMSLWCLDLEHGEALQRITIHNVELRVSMYWGIKGNEGML